MVIESVFEDLQLKKDLFNQMGEILKQRSVPADQMLLCSNTMNLSLADMTEDVCKEYRGCCIGMRFLHPVWFIDEVELADCDYTRRTTVNGAEKLLKQLFFQPFFYDNCYRRKLTLQEISTYQSRQMLRCPEPLKSLVPRRGLALTPTLMPTPTLALAPAPTLALALALTLALTLAPTLDPRPWPEQARFPKKELAGRGLAGLLLARPKLRELPGRLALGAGGLGGRARAGGLLVVVAAPGEPARRGGRGGRGEGAVRRLPRRAALRLARAVRPHGHVHRVLDARAARPKADMRRVQAADREGAAAGHKPAHPCVCICMRMRTRVPLRTCTRLPSVSLLCRAWRMASGASGLQGGPCSARLTRRPERAAREGGLTHALHTCSVRTLHALHVRSTGATCDAAALRAAMVGLDEGVRPWTVRRPSSAHARRFNTRRGCTC